VSALILIAALVGAWELYVRLSGVDTIVVAAPSEVASSLWDDRSLLWSNLLVTGREIVLGLLVAVIVALALAVIVHVSPPLRRAVMPLLAASQAIPIVVIAPILVVWFGFDIRPKIAIVAIVTVFPIVVTTLDGLESLDPGLRKLLRTFGASRWRTLRLVEAPAAVPGLLTGTRIAVAVAVIGAVLAEDAGASSGLGLVIKQANNQLLTARAFAAVVVLAVLAGALFAALTYAERRLAPWAARSRYRESRNQGGIPT
jgi:NitT/TauT family transport system permease protein/putative hydroxymethylpyrimidine transport system permease protein